MNTIQKIIERVDRVKPNALSPETKVEWIAELDGKIALDVLLMDWSELSQFNYEYPDALEMKPLVRFPHDAIYDKWLIAQIDAICEEWDRYANDMEVYNSYFKNYVRWIASTYRPAQGGMECCGTYPRYFLTAYGLAVQQGFTGSVEQWLESLRGAPGQTPVKGKDYYTPEELEETLDLFADRVPKDWFASGAAIPEESDLDEYRISGKFYSANTTVTSTLKNRPTDAEFTLWVFDRVSDNRKSHMLIDSENRLFFRSEHAAGWGQWVGWAAVDDTLSKKGFAADAAAVKSVIENLTAESVKARPNTWMPTALEVGARADDWLPTPKEIGAAPSGYGLGSPVVDIKAADINTTTYNGWYRIAGENDFTIGGYKYGDWHIHVSKYSNSNLVQEMYSLNGYKAIRLCYNGTWYEEWENPPMELGKEYRTTERHDGKPVYVKRLDLGTLPSSGNKSTTYCSSGGEVVRWEAYATSGSGSVNVFPFFTAGGDLRAKIYFTDVSVVVAAISDSSGNTGKATVWYTKK